MAFEYKCVGGPERPKRLRGMRSRSERVALALQEIISAEAVDGWEYLRTDLVPVEEKAGFFSRTQEVHRAVLVFRRENDVSRPARPAPARGVVAAPEPEISFQSDAPERDGREPRIALSAERPPALRRANRPPTGLG